MPRRARICLPGYPQHIVQRGHNRAPCFSETRDYELYLGLLGELRLEFACSVHAFVLMPNHVHLLLTSDAPGNVSELIRRLNLRFVQARNRWYRRTGSAWQGRFWSSVVEGGSYLLNCHRYIELNPVRAGIVANPEQYPWSSHRFNALGEASLVVDEHPQLLSVDADPGRRRAAYRALFSEDVPAAEIEAIRAALRSSLPYGSDPFVSALESTLGRRMRNGRPGRPRRVNSEAELFPD
jgi:putative transposase